MLSAVPASPLLGVASAAIASEGAEEVQMDGDEPIDDAQEKGLEADPEVPIPATRGSSSFAAADDVHSELAEFIGLDGHADRGEQGPLGLGGRGCSAADVVKKEDVDNFDDGVTESAVPPPIGEGELFLAYDDL